MKGRSSWAMAYCGMAAALSVALMLLGAVVPVLMFIAPAAASLLIATVCMECGMKMALTAYGAVSLLSLLFVSDKEVALVFVFLLGYYPLVKPKFERIRPKLLRGVCKLLLCNGALAAMYGLVLLLVPAGSISQELRTTAWIVSLSTLAMGNVAFLRTSIELLASFFAPGEVSEIWITFPDPQMRKTRKRLTSTRFMELYRQVLADGGMVRLKTDSPFLYAYTRAMADLNGLRKEVDTADLYAAGLDDPILDIKTHYERQWLARGLTIKYIAFALDHHTQLAEPADEFERDTYRSYSRGIIQNEHALD